MDLTTIIGLLGAFGFTIWAILLHGELGMYYDITAVMIVFGGSTFAVLMKFSMTQFLGAMKVAGRAFSYKLPRAEDLIEEIVQLADASRRGGLLSLEGKEVSNDFLAKGIQLLVDGAGVVEGDHRGRARGGNGRAPYRDPREGARQLSIRICRSHTRLQTGSQNHPRCARRHAGRHLGDGPHRQRADRDAQVPIELGFVERARAVSVAMGLFDGGKLDQRRFTVTGYGDTKPLDPNDTTEGRARNRRVEIVIEQKLGEDVKEELATLREQNPRAYEEMRDTLMKRFDLRPDEIF